MSSSSSQAVSGGVYFTDPDAAKSNWVLWGIAGAVVLVLIFVLGKK